VCVFVCVCVLEKALRISGAAIQFLAAG